MNEPIVAEAPRPVVVTARRHKDGVRVLYSEKQPCAPYLTALNYGEMVAHLKEGHGVHHLIARRRVLNAALRMREDTAAAS